MICSRKRKVMCAKQNFILCVITNSSLPLLIVNNSGKGLRNRPLLKYNLSVFQTLCLFSPPKKFFFSYKCVMIDGNLQFVVQTN